MRTRSLNGTRHRTPLPALPATPATREVRVPIKPLTARNLSALNADVEQKRQILAVAEQRLHDSLRSIYTEHGIEEGQPQHITESEPHELVVLVPKGG